MALHPDLMDLLEAFSSSNVEYLVVGGWAVSVMGRALPSAVKEGFFGHARATQ